MPGKAPAIGIDLGTTFSCVAIWQNGKVQIIPNDQGNMVTPSYVAFTDTERLIGDAAKAQVSINPENTVFDSKRLIGRTYDDPRVQYDIGLWNFQVVDDNNKPLVEVRSEGVKRRFHPEEISAIVLSSLKESAENYLGMKVTDAVVTVPAYFNDAQRQCTKDAGKIAGLNVLRIINEPTAAALAYGLDKKLKEANNILVYDLGGGTFDVSVLTIKGTHLKVLSTAGNTHLGGEDFDNCLLDYFVNDFKLKYGRNLTGLPKSMRRLRTACEEAKRALSSLKETTVTVDSICGTIDFVYKLRRPMFEDLCIGLFRKTLRTVETALNDAKMDKSQIDDVVLVGGSTRIPMIRQMVTDFFGGKEPCKSIHPDEAVAYGAAIQASIMSRHDEEEEEKPSVGQAGEQDEQVMDIVLEDVTPMSLGLEVADGNMEVIVEKNMAVPCQMSKGFTTSVDNQDSVSFRVFEGDHAKVESNNLLDSFSITDLPPAPRGVPDIQVTFNIDADGILTISAVETASGTSSNVTIKNDRGHLSQSEIERMMKDAEKYQVDEEKRKERKEARAKLEGFVFQLKQDVRNASDSEILVADKVEMMEKCDQVLEWLETDQLEEKDDCEYQMKKLQKEYLMKKLNALQV